MRLVSVAVVLAASTALASWVDAGQLGGVNVLSFSMPTATQVDGGVIEADVVFAANNVLQRVRVRSDGTQQLIAQGAATTYQVGVGVGAGCVAGVNATGTLVVAGAAPCAVGTQSLGAGVTPLAMAGASGGPFSLLVKTLGGLRLFVSPDGGTASANWALEDLPGRKEPLRRAMSVSASPLVVGYLRDDNTDGGNDELVLRDALGASSVIASAANSAEVQLVRARDGGIGVLRASSDSSGLRFAPIAGGAELTPSIGGAFAPVRGFSLRPEGGLLSGGQGLFAPVPLVDALGTQWSARAEAPASGTGVFRRVACANGLACAVWLDNPSQILVLFNQAPPVISPPTVTPLSANAQAALALSVSDDDQDPTVVRWTVLDAGPLGVSVRGDGGVEHTVALQAGASLVCSSEGALISATATDGLREVTRLIAVPSVPAGPADVIVDAGVPELPAGAPPRAAVVQPGACVPPSVTWSLLFSSADFALPDGGAELPRITPISAREALVLAPEHLCRPTPAALQVVATPSAGADAGRATLNVLPWGPTNTPALPFLIEGVSPFQRTLSTTGTPHVCSGTAGLPITALRVVASGSPNVSVVSTGEALEITAPECVGGELEALVSRAFADGTGESNEVTMFVRIDAGFGPTDGGSLALDGAPNGASIGGELQVRGVGCLPERGWRVALSLERDGGVVLDGGTVPVAAMPTPWSLQVPGCAAGRYVARGEVVSSMGVAQGIGDAVAFDSPGLPLAIGALSVDEVPVRCGERLSVPVTVLPVSDACPPEQLDWRSSGGPPLERERGQGGTWQLEPSTLEFDALAARDVTFTIDAISGDQRAQAERTVHLKPEPFVAIARRQTPLGTEAGDALSMVITAANTTECAVSGVTFLERLDGAQLVGGSVRVNGAPADVTWDARGFSIEGLAFEPNGTLEVSYRARLPILGRPGTATQMTVRGDPVLLPVGAAPVPSGCGCDGAPGLLGLAALGLLVRRRRRLG